MCKEPYCVYLEPEIDRWIDGERRKKEEEKRICLLCFDLKKEKMFSANYISKKRRKQKRIAKRDWN